MAYTQFTIRIPEPLDAADVEHLDDLLSQAMKLAEVGETGEFEITHFVNQPKLTVKIEHDPVFGSPREEYDNLGKLYLRDPRLTGDKLANDPMLENEETGEMEEDPDVFICLPVYAYEHGGITVSHGSFSCRWDSGQVGWHYMLEKDVRENFPGLEGAELYERCKECLEAELKEYDCWLQGDVWYFTVEDEEGETVGSCGGFIGDDELVLDQMFEHTPDGVTREMLKSAWESRYD